MVRIAYLAPRYPPDVGGVETHVSRLAVRAVREGYEVDVLTEDARGALPTVERIEGVTVRRYRAANVAGRYPFAPALWRATARIGGSYDLLHAHSYHAFPALGALLVHDTPVVFTPHYHGPGHSRLGAILHRPYRIPGGRLMRRASAIIAVSESEARLIRADFPFVSRRLTVIPNGVDAADSVGSDIPGQKRILTVGRLKNYKGVGTLIDAVSLLPEAYSLSVVGEGPALSSLRAQAAGPALTGRVRFLGTISDRVLDEEYTAASVYVSMSSQEAFGLTLADALARRLPVVATDIPAHREVVELAGNAHASLLNVNASSSELAAEIEVAASRGRAPLPPRLPSWDEVSQMTFDLYQRILSTR